MSAEKLDGGGDFDVVDTIIRAGWANFCEKLRDAGASIIDRPENAIRGLRFLADKLEEHAKKRGEHEQE